MADTRKSDSGFQLPAPNEAPAPAPAPPPQATQPAQQSAPPLPAAETATQPRDLLIGGAVLLVLVVAFFFAKNAYANLLVGRRVAPPSANAAGWWLWVFLTLLAVGVVLAAVNNSLLMTPFIVGPLTLGAIVALVLMLLSSRR